MNNQFEVLLDKMNEADDDQHDRFLEWCQLQGIEADNEAYHRFMGEEEDRKEVDESNMFVADRIEMLQDKMAELDKLAKGTRKGKEQSHIYRQIDALEAELTKARIEAGEE